MAYQEKRIYEGQANFIAQNGNLLIFKAELLRRRQI